MTTRNTPPPPPVEARSSDELVEELGLALRDAASWSISMPDDPRAQAHIERVKASHGELTRRGIDLAPSLADLTQQTGWLMAPFLEECLRYSTSSPAGAIAPMVRDTDGVRRRFRCPRCGVAEFPDNDGIRLCDQCLAEAAAAVAERRRLDGLLVFRSYTPERWCSHADAETVLMAIEDYDEGGPCYCAVCLADERQRRANRRSDFPAAAT
jgi:hypothetical protein